jgi:hypothetical protein
VYSHLVTRTSDSRLIRSPSKASLAADPKAALKSCVRLAILACSPEEEIRDDRKRDHEGDQNDDLDRELHPRLLQRNLGRALAAPPGRILPEQLGISEAAVSLPESGVPTGSSTAAAAISKALRRHETRRISQRASNPRQPDQRGSKSGSNRAAAAA